MHIPELPDVQIEKATHKALSTCKIKAQGRFQCASEVKTDFHGKERKNQDEGIKRAQVNSVSPTEKCRTLPLCVFILVISTPALFYSMVLHRVVNSAQMVHEVILSKKHQLGP